MIAADRDQARAIFHFVSGLLKAVPLLRKMVVSANRQRIELSNRVAIEIGTASFRTTRGYTFAAVLGRRGGVLALRRELGQSRHRDHAGDKARAGDHSRQHAADGDRARTPKEASSITLFVAITARTTLRF